jgi:hypothetical protein
VFVEPVDARRATPPMPDRDVAQWQQGVDQGAVSLPGVA